MNRIELVIKLELVGRALADNSLIPVFQCFAFNKSTVTAYNDSLGIIAPCETDDAFAVNGGTLLGLLKASQSEDVEFRLEAEELIVKAGRSTFKLPYFNEKEFLFEVPEMDIAMQMPLDEDMMKGLEACLLTSSRDQAQPALMGVCWNNSSLFSCDSDALSRFHFKVKMTDEPKPYTMPNNFCETILKIGVRAELSVDDQWVHAYFDGYQVYGRLIENDNPLDHAAEIKKTLKTTPEFVSVPKGLNEALSRARVVADPESSKTTLTVAAGRLKLLTSTHMGVVRDTLAFGKHEEIEVNVSAALVQRSISLCDEMVILENVTCYRNGKTLLQIIGNME